MALPLTALQANALQANVLQANVFANDRPPRRTILLVEDEPFVREATRSILENAGFEVLRAGDAKDALIVYEARKPSIDLVITDMGLPGRSGLQLTQDLRERSPKLMVLLTSGYISPEYETKAAVLCTHFLAKPYSTRTLIDKVEQILAAATLGHPATQAG